MKKVAKYAACAALIGVLTAVIFQKPALPDVVKNKFADYAISQAWQRSGDGLPHRPWPWMAASPYAKMTVPALHKSLFVFDGEAHAGLSYGPVLTGIERNKGYDVSLVRAPAGNHFSFLPDLVPGMRLTFQIRGGAVQTYRVDSVEIDRNVDAGIARHAGADVLLLVTSFRPAGAESHKPLHMTAVVRRIVDNQLSTS
jgi:sortase A